MLIKNWIIDIKAFFWYILELFLTIGDAMGYI
jgi:hypothetical protein